MGSLGLGDLDLRIGLDSMDEVDELDGVYLSVQYSTPPRGLTLNEEDGNVVSDCQSATARICSRLLTYQDPNYLHRYRNERRNLEGLGPTPSVFRHLYWNIDLQYPQIPLIR